MDSNNLTLIKFILPEGILDDFVLINVEEDNGTLKIHLDEKNNLPTAHKDKPLVSKGFFDSSCLEDFPIRTHKVILFISRRKWKDKKTGKVYFNSFKLNADGTRYTKELGAFLKGTPRYYSC